MSEQTIGNTAQNTKKQEIVTIQDKKSQGIQYLLKTAGSTGALNKKQLLSYIQKHFQPEVSPHHFITYQVFKKTFDINEDNYRLQNQSIIDIHLRFRHCVFAQMFAFKWIPALLQFSFSLFSKNKIGYILPAFYVLWFNHYMQPFFVWKMSKQLKINMRKQFMRKISKQQNINNRIQKFIEIESELKANKQIPKKYLKFGEWTQYNYHTWFKGVEESNFFLTPTFEMLFYLTHPAYIKWKDVKNKYEQYKNSWKEFKKIPLQDRDKILMIDEDIDLKTLLTHRSIPQGQSYTPKEKPSVLVKYRLRRVSQLINYLVTGEFKKSQVDLSSLVTLYQHTNILNYDDQKYGIDSDGIDIGLFYGAMTIPLFIKFILRRR